MIMNCRGAVRNRVHVKPNDVTTHKRHNQDETPTSSMHELKITCELSSSHENRNFDVCLRGDINVNLLLRKYYCEGHTVEQIVVIGVYACAF